MPLVAHPGTCVNPQAKLCERNQIPETLQPHKEEEGYSKAELRNRCSVEAQRWHPITGLPRCWLVTDNAEN
jgi:hypothetical protein